MLSASVFGWSDFSVSGRLLYIASRLSGTTVDDISPVLPELWDYGRFLIMGNAGVMSSKVCRVACFGPHIPHTIWAFGKSWECVVQSLSEKDLLNSIE